MAGEVASMVMRLRDQCGWLRTRWIWGLHWGRSGITYVRHVCKDTGEKMYYMTHQKLSTHFECFDFARLTYAF